MSLIDQIKTINTKEFTLICGYCRERVVRHSLVELGEAVTHNSKYNCRVCIECDREITIDKVLDVN